MSCRKTTCLLMLAICLFPCMYVFAEPVNTKALRCAIIDLKRTYPETYTKGYSFLERLALLEQSGDEVELEQLRREALLENPLLDFDELLVIRRSDKSPALGLPANWQGNCSLPAGPWKSKIIALSMDDLTGEYRTIFRPKKDVFVGDMDLHFDAQRLLFSMPDDNQHWQIWEIDLADGSIRRMTPADDPDVDNYDACYLPDGRIIFASTACYAGIPCVFGGDNVANLCVINRDGSGLRQLCFDQDHNWCPVVMHDGRVMYQRWEYSDLPHSNSRLLFSMNPDGTAQMELYGSNSYWPNSIFYARPVPGHPTMFAGIVTGHHGVRRMGELVLFDPAKGRHEADGVVQRIPGFGQKVEPIFKDRLVDDSWPKFLHPWPLSEKYFLVASQPTPESRWGIYLVDVFDNMVLLREEPDFVLFQPIPLRKRPVPPVVPSKVELEQQTALVYLSDLYAGSGLAGVPKGTIKALRLFTYTYSYRGMGGLLGTIGMDGPWDIKRVLGTVPVSPDGSAYFRAPANTPIAVQPLDDRGMAVQQMRSWFTAMPGETLSCVGCHEKQNMAPPAQPLLAMRREPDVIAPWYGPERGFSFAREVQPVLDRYCVACHESNDDSADIPPYLRGDRMITDWSSQIAGHGNSSYAGKFSESYAQLHRFVRRPGIESDYHLLNAMEFHASTTELVQMLDKGHYGVKLNQESWDRLIMWIDLNAPYHGTWTEIMGEERVGSVAKRARELRNKYANTNVNFEYIPEQPVVIEDDAPVLASIPKKETLPLTAVANPPLFTGERRVIALNGEQEIELVLVPAGSYVMGSNSDVQREHPMTVVEIDQPFWISTCEITNAEYKIFDPGHDSGVESKYGYQFGLHGYPVNEPDQPVVRISCEEALAFCDWLSEKTGLAFTLPTEVEWEYACRAGTDTEFSFGGSDSDYSAYANLADETMEQFASNPYLVFAPFEKPSRYDAWIPRDTRFSDGVLLSAKVGSFSPNAWGLYDMHGNVWEWTCSPYVTEAQECDNNPKDARYSVRGGSWGDRPRRAGVSFRLAYQPWQRVYNVGFRVLCRENLEVALR